MTSTSGGNPGPEKDPAAIDASSESGVESEAEPTSEAPSASGSNAAPTTEAPSASESGGTGEPESTTDAPSGTEPVPTTDGPSEPESTSDAPSEPTPSEPESTTDAPFGAGSESATHTSPGTESGPPTDSVVSAGPSDPATAGQETEAEVDGATEKRVGWLQQRWPLPPSPEHDPRRSARRRTTAIFFAGVALTGLIVLVVYQLVKTPSEGPQVITERSFITAANDLCRERLPDLRPPATTEDEVLSPAQIADRVDEAAEGVTQLAGLILGLPIENPAQDEARRDWLSDWRLYAFIGHQYADLLRDGNVRDAQDKARSGGSSYTRADRFARANDLDGCQFFAVLRSDG